MELASLAKFEPIIEKIQPLAKQLTVAEGFETIALLLDKKYKADLEAIREEMAKITKDQFEIVAADVDEESTAALVVFNKTYAEPVREFLWGSRVSQIRLPDGLATEPYDVIFKKLKERVREIPADLKKVKDELAEISKDWYLQIRVMKEVLQDRLEEIQAVSQLGQTDYTFVINGWMPKKYLERSRKALRDEFGERVILSEVEVDPHELEEAPIMYENPSFAKPFELVMKIFSPPGYGTIDPTPFVAIFFPLFFGMIVGDIGYGLTILALALLAKRKYKKMMGVQAITSIFTMAALSAILFGFFYGEFFGDLPHKLHLIHEIEKIGSFKLPFHLPFKREELMMPLLFMALGIGAAHLILGLILGVLNAIREKSRKHALEKSGMLATLFSLFLIIAISAGKLPSLLMTPAFGVLLIGFVLLIYGGGPLGVFEIFGVIGKIFSYARLMALGLAGVILAVVANKLAGSMGNIAVGIMIAGLLHVINIIVGAFSPSIHSLRLNFVEFFGQFFESGGKEYKPFKKAGGE